MGDAHEFEDMRTAQNNVFEDFEEHSAHARVSTPDVVIRSLRNHYLDYTLTTTGSSRDIIQYAQAGHATAKLDVSKGTIFRLHEPAKGRSTGNPGTMVDNIKMARYDYDWKDKDFILYVVEYSENFRPTQMTCILHRRADQDTVDGRCKPADELIAAASDYGSKLHDEVFVFDQLQWTKNKDLWKSIHHSSWDDVILESEMKEALMKDVEGFFDCEKEYKEFAVPWKRGIIFHGLPGNGKTISLKALMHSLYSRPDPIPTLYVKSLAGCHGPEYAIREIFVKARDTTPCLLVFEDLDSLITDKVRSFFLNEVDGLENNDGILMIGSTNHLERLDAGISKRPGRFDRKYHFNLPTAIERAQYCDYWALKLSKNKSISFPPSLSHAIASITDSFSFAYLKEAFIAALLVLVATQRAERAGVKAAEEPSQPDDKRAEASAGDKELEDNQLWRLLRKQVQTLRTEMSESHKSVMDAEKNNAGESGKSARRKRWNRSARATLIL